MRRVRRFVFTRSYKGVVERKINYFAYAYKILLRFPKYLLSVLGVIKHTRARVPDNNKGDLKVLKLRSA